MIYTPGVTSKSIDVQIVDDTGLPVTGLLAATFPAVYWTIAGNTAATLIALSDLALITTAYSSGGVKERAGSAGIYRLDIPDAALASAGDVRIYGEATGKRLICEPLAVGYGGQTGDNYPFAARTVIRGTVGATLPSTTSFTPSALDVAGIALNQLAGRVIIFDKDTTTTALRGQATAITGSSIATLPLLTYTALTTAPVSGDTFYIV